MSACPLWPLIGALVHDPPSLIGNTYDMTFSVVAHNCHSLCLQAASEVCHFLKVPLPAGSSGSHSGIPLLLGESAFAYTSIWMDSPSFVYCLYYFWLPMGFNSSQFFVVLIQCLFNSLLNSKLHFDYHYFAYLTKCEPPP